MTRHRKAVACLGVLCGCATPPTAAEIAAADIGSPPTQVEAERRALELLAADQLTPERFGIEFAPLRRNWYRASGFSEPRFGWQLDATVTARSRSLRRTPGVGANQFYWEHGRCVARTFDTRMLDGSRVRAFLALDPESERVAPRRSDPAGAESQAGASASVANASRIDVLLLRRSTLRSMRRDHHDEPELGAAIDLLLEAIDRQLAAAGHSGR